MVETKHGATKAKKKTHMAMHGKDVKPVLNID
jgi:hypothetical protein